MDPPQEIYRSNPGFSNRIMALLIVGGMAGIAFWDRVRGMQIGFPLVIGFRLLPAVALVTSADENRRCIQEPGPWAGLLLEAIF